MMNAIRWLLAAGISGLGIAGLALHATVKDADQAWAPLFYLLPWPVVGAVLMFAGWLTRWRFLRRLLWLAGGLAWGWWLFQSYGWAYPANGDWKVMTWNMARPVHPFAPLIELVRSERPDVVALVESGNISARVIPAYERALPGYRMAVMPGGLACLARGEIHGASVSSLANGSCVAHLQVRRPDGSLNVFVADLGASPFFPRRPQLDRLAAMAGGQRRTVVMGDFNTPLESVHLDPMRAHFAAAMEGPHRGFRETWFYTLPLLSLDQIWLSRDFEPQFARRRPTFASDHAPVIATFSVKR